MPCPLLELCSVHYYQKGHMSTSLLLSTSQGWDTPTCNWQTFRTINKFSKLYFPYFHKWTIVLLFPRVKLSKGSNILKVIMKITFVSIPWLLWLVLQLTRGQGSSCLFSEQFYLHVLYFGSYCDFVCTLLKVSYSGHTNLHPQEQYSELFTPSTLMSFLFLMITDCIRNEMLSHCDFDSWFPGDECCWVFLRIPDELCTTSFE